VLLVLEDGSLLGVKEVSDGARASGEGVLYFGGDPDPQDLVELVESDRGRERVGMETAGDGLR